MNHFPSWATKYQIVLLAASLLFNGTLAAAPAVEKPPLQMGVVPFLSTEQLFRFFTPMKLYLEQKLGRQIVLSTAPDFRSLIARAAYADYDIYVTAPHFALLAEQETKYQQVARMQRLLEPIIVVRKDDPVQRMEDLRGHRIARPHKLALISILGEAMLRKHGMEAGRDYEVQEGVSHNNVLIRVAENDADAAFATQVALDHVPVGVRNRLRVMATLPQLPHLMIMAGPKLGEADVQALTQALLAFTPEGTGKEFFDLTGFGGITPITPADIEALQPFLSLLKERLK